MKKLCLCILTAGCFVSASAQTACGPAWLKEERTSNYSKAPWEYYTGPRVRKLYRSEYFNLPSDRDHATTLDLNAGQHYTVLFYTGFDAQASGIELRDAGGLRLTFEKSYGKSVNNWLEITYEASHSGSYIVAVRSIFPSDHASCAALLVREWDDAEWNEKQRENRAETGD